MVKIAWSAPPTFTAGNVLTAAQLNILTADLNETAPAKATVAGQHFVATAANAIAARLSVVARVETNETTAGTTLADLATSGPAVTVTTGTRAIVTVSCLMSNNTVGGGAQMSYAVSGASSLTENADRGIRSKSRGAGDDYAMSRTSYDTRLTAGSNTFTAKYSAVSTGTAAFQFREISVVPY